MKLRLKQRQKSLAMTPCKKIVTPFSFFRCMANLEQSGGRIPDVESAKLMFSLIVPFYLTKIENRTKNSLTQL